MSAQLRAGPWNIASDVFLQKFQDNPTTGPSMAALQYLKIRQTQDCFSIKKKKISLERILYCPFCYALWNEDVNSTIK